MDYHLHLETDSQEGVIRLRLVDQHGTQLGDNQLRLVDHSAVMWEGLFDTRAHVQRFSRAQDCSKPAGPGDLLAQLGVFLADHVLGKRIVGALTQWNQRPTLLVHLPPIRKNQENDPLAVALARVPWEIARPGFDQASLLERNVVVRAVPAELAPTQPPLAEPADGEPLRVLFVYAEAMGSRPLAMRLERERLLDLFFEGILPKRLVEIDVLCHGVTKRRLEEQIRVARGYHLVHWSGHGCHDLLELPGENGERDYLKGANVVELFKDAGGFIPQLVFLSACLSAALVEATDWDELRTAMQSGEIGPGRKPPPEVGEIVKEQPGYTSVALALLQSGVPQVIAMRYEVGDPYARELARVFYMRLLGDKQPDSAENALSLARHELLHDGRDDRNAFDVVDHATPLILGHAGQPVKVSIGRSEQLKRRRPRPQPLLRGGSDELDPAKNFVGRSEELTCFAEHWLPQPGDANRRRRRPGIALAQGLAGLGKTALCAEVIHLFHHNFDLVFAYQAKPTKLTVDDFYRRIHRSLLLESTVYREKVDDQPYGAIYLEVSAHLTATERYERMRENLVEALRDERILIVLDNFETNLETVPADGGGYHCSEPEWDRLLQRLAQCLHSTRSRVLVTCRHPIAMLSEDNVVWLPLGPLPMAEAALFIQGDVQLLKLAKDDWRLVRRLLIVSRGHPLILSRLATLADEPAALEDALDKLEKGLHSLPDVFTRDLSREQMETQRRYLDDVATHSVDLLIERASPLARRLLWTATLANEPVFEAMLEHVWSERSMEDEKLRIARAWYQPLSIDQREEWLAKQATETKDELRELLERPNHDAPPETPPIAPLLGELCAAGLLQRSGADEWSMYSFHELVRERATDWMSQHAEECEAWTKEKVWKAYGEWYAMLFQGCMAANKEGVRDTAAEAGRRALVYLIRAGAYGQLDDVAATLVTGTHDPSVLNCVIAELKELPDQIPPGETRWSLRTYLADALSMAGRGDEALSLYEQAACEAEQAGHWSAFAWITNNWSHTLVDIGQLKMARATQLKSAEAYRKAGAPLVNIRNSELVVLRIDVKLGCADKALPEIEKRLDELRSWWRRSSRGEHVGDAPYRENLARVLADALDIAREASLTLQRWQTCLDLLAETITLKAELGEGRHEIAITSLDAYLPLLRLGRVTKARDMLERCLKVFREVGDVAGQAKVLWALAQVWHERPDTGQAVTLAKQSLALSNSLPDPAARASSHESLSNFLARLDHWTESAQHRLAAIAYFFAIKHEQHLLTVLHNFAGVISLAVEARQRYELPRLEELLQLPDFQPLKAFLEQYKVSIPDLQEAIDELDQKVRQKLSG